MNESSIRLGTQGWSYKDWIGPFYPPGTAASNYLAFYSQIFDTVELDATFYGPPRAETVRLWHSATPNHFLFAAKMPGAITHERRLVGVEAELVEFLMAISELGPKLGPVLIQLPPSFTTEEAPSLEKFVDILPDDFRYAVEFRNRSWLNPRTLELLSRHGIAWTNIDLHYMPVSLQATTDFTYVRWLGNRRDVQSLNRIQIDRSKEIEHWAGELERIAARVQRIYGYINNHYAGHSPESVRQLRRQMGLPVPALPVAPEQGILLTAPDCLGRTDV